MTLQIVKTGNTYQIYDTSEENWQNCNSVGSIHLHEYLAIRELLTILFLSRGENETTSN